MEEVRVHLESDDELITPVSPTKSKKWYSVLTHRTDDLRDALIIACIVFVLLIPNLQQILRSMIPNSSASLLMTVNALIVASVFLASR